MAALPDVQRTALFGAGGPTAVACASDTLAFELMHHLRAAGLRVPGDVPVIGVHSLRMAEFAIPPLTTVDIGLFEIGYETARQIHTLAGKSSPRSVEITFAPRLVERASVAPARSRL